MKKLDDVMAYAEPANLLPCDGNLTLRAHALSLQQADRYFTKLRDDLAWEAREATIMGRKVALPRLTAWYGEAAYGYSGVRHDPLGWTETLLELKHGVEALSGGQFNSVLLNLYRDGRDSMGWHADDEAVLGPEPLIASLSLGCARRFRVRHRADHGRKLSLVLEPGSLLVMSGRMQACWQHEVPKTALAVGPRINMTFRRILGG